VGTCACARLTDWFSKIDQIGPTFGAMIEERGYDASKTLIEFYRSQKEIHILLPLPS